MYISIWKFGVSIFLKKLIVEILIFFPGFIDEQTVEMNSIYVFIGTFDLFHLKLIKAAQFILNLMEKKKEKHYFTFIIFNQNTI